MTNPVLPEDLACARCGDAIERGYVPVESGDPRPEAAVCGTCGWREMGHAGCAPTLAEFAVDPPATLLRVEADADGARSTTVTDSEG